MTVNDCIVSPCFDYLNEKYVIPRKTNPVSLKSGLHTLEKLTSIVQDNSWDNADVLISKIHEKCSQLISSELETAMLNVSLRFLKFIREEALKHIYGNHADFEENLSNRLFAMGEIDYSKVKRDDIQDAVLAAVDELGMDLKSSLESLSALSLNFIHSDELIMTVGHSKSVYNFLHHATKNGRSFKVIVTECSPENSGHKMACDLSKAGIYTILVSDSHVYGLMSRVNKLIVNCDAVYPDGTIRAVTGTHCAMIAAKKFTVPTYVCLSPHKVSPIAQNAYLCKVNESSQKQNEIDAVVEGTKSLKIQRKKSKNKGQINILSGDASNEKAEPFFQGVDNPRNVECDPDYFYSPFKIIPLKSFEDDEDSKYLYDAVRIWSPKWEYIPSGLVGLFLTSMGGHPPSYLYAMVREFFHPTDVNEAISWI